MKWFLRIGLTLLALAVILFFIFRTPDTDAAEMRAKYGAEPSQFLEIGGGVKVHLRDEGPRDGTPIILLHGSNADLHTWEPWVERLKDTYRVIRFDQIGHGLTGPNSAGDHSTASFIEDIGEVADALGLERFILGGNSMGGSHTIGYAIENPERLMGIVLVDAGGIRVEEKADGNTGFDIARTPVINQLIKHVTPRSLIEQSLRESVSNEAIVTPEAVDRYWELLRYPGNRGATLERFSRPWAGFDRERIAQVTVPALILWGEDDGLIPVSVGKLYNDLLPQSELVIYPEIGHLPQEEAPDATIADLDRWLGQLPVSRTEEAPGN